MDLEKLHSYTSRSEKINYVRESEVSDCVYLAINDQNSDSYVVISCAIAFIS